MENNLEFRKQLERITEGGNSFSKHPDLIEALRSQYPHKIFLEKLVSKDKMQNYNCFMYALGVADSISIKQEMVTLGKHEGFTGDFIQLLINKRYLKEDVGGNIVIYFDGDRSKHAGLKNNDGKIISKWGWGNLWWHELWEIPLMYGDSIKTFSYRLYKTDTEKEFRDWVQWRYRQKSDRNDPCPCGSGKKWKKCHGLNY